MKRCVFNVKELSRQGGSGEYQLDDEFLSLRDDGEISGGNIAVTVTVKEAAADDYDYDLDIALRGTLRVPCTRCLDDMDYDVDTADSVHILCDSAAGPQDDEDMLTAATDGRFDASDRIYETLLLGIPTVHVHPDGQCNPEMIGRITTELDEE